MFLGGNLHFIYERDILENQEAGIMISVHYFILIYWPEWSEHSIFVNAELFNINKKFPRYYAYLLEYTSLYQLSPWLADHQS